jgi:uncharacterized protein YndB with AHSA1/START domain
MLETGLELVRVLPAPPEQVFRAWTDASLLARWMSPVGRAEVEADPRPGGRLTVTMIGAGTRIEHTGEYLEVVPPHRLVFTWISPYTGDVPSLVTVELEPEGDGTRLTLRHEQLPPEAATSHVGGWERMLSRLQEVV